MNITLRKLGVLLVVALFVTSCDQVKEGPVKVEIKEQDGKYQLYRGGEPYYIYGAGSNFNEVDSLAKAGANSFRTWSTKLKELNVWEELDRAHELGMTVALGFWLPREDSEFDYNDTALLREQKEDFLREVNKYKDHPAVLAWVIGNELNHGKLSSKVWEVVNDLSKVAHEVDPYHLTTTTFAWFSPENAQDVKTYLTDIDFVSIQIYGDAINVVKRVQEADYHGPYVVSEWGATGHWEMPKTEWGIAIEQTSTEKAHAIAERWEKAVGVNRGQCLGSYIFVYNDKQERTPTWYGLLVDTGEETEPIDYMTKVWTGEWPENRCPTIDSVFIDNMGRFDNIHLTAGDKHIFRVYSSDPDSDSLTMRIEIMPDIVENYKGGGEFEDRPHHIDIVRNVAFNREIEFTVPKQEGPYRIFAYIYDGNNNAATANVPFYVDLK